MLVASTWLPLETLMPTRAARSSSASALRDQRFGQIQVDLTLYFAGARSDNGGAQIDPAVIVGGAIVFCLLKHRSIADRVVLCAGSKAVEVKGRDRIECHAPVALEVRETSPCCDQLPRSASPSSSTSLDVSLCTLTELVLTFMLLVNQA